MDTHTGTRELIHIPLGHEHPYNKAPYERCPRQPKDGESVQLGVVTSPSLNGGSVSVWVEWSLAGSEETHRADAQADGEWEGKTCWLADLPAFHAGDRVAYSVHGLFDQDELSTETFSFTVPGWYSLADLQAIRMTTNGVEFLTATPYPGLFVAVGIEVTSEDTVQLRIRPEDPAEGEWASIEPANPDFAEETPETVVVVRQGFRVRARKHPFTFELSHGDGGLILAEAEPIALLVDPDGRILECKQTFASPPDEAFYGFGERFNALDQRGARFDNYVFEQWRSQGTKTYIPVPFFLSSRRYGYFIHTYRNIYYDMASRHPERWSVSVEVGAEGALETTLLAASDLKAIVARYTDLTGKPALPPDWIYGLWMSSNDWNNQALVMEQMEKTLEHDIPATVLVIEAWSDELSIYLWNDAQYTPKPNGEPFRYADFTFPPDGHWPRPKEMVDAFHRNGIRMVLWQIPILRQQNPDMPAHVQKQHDIDEKIFIEKGYCVREANGEPYRVRPGWFHNDLVPDFTNPEVMRWWMDQRRYLLEDLGIDGFKTDGGEHMWGQDLRFFDGRCSDEVRNEYPILYQQGFSQYALGVRKGDAVLFSRSGYTGAQRNPCHWAGDEASTWEAFRASIRAGLNAGISGISFWGWDLAGFSGDVPSAELYLRAAAMATFCPIMQYHSEYNARQKPCRDRTPWNIQERSGDPTVIPTFRYLANLRMNLLPYIANEARFSSQSGLPLMRALPLESPDDPTCRKYPYQYMFGRSLLVAPVVESGLQEQAVYLPAGHWYDFWTGQPVAGGEELTVPVPMDRVPVFVRAGTILPLNLGDSLELGSPVGNAVDRYRRLTFRIYPQAGEQSLLWQDPVSRRDYLIRGMHDPETGHTSVVLPNMTHMPVLALPDGRELRP